MQTSKSVLARTSGSLMLHCGTPAAGASSAEASRMYTRHERLCAHGSRRGPTPPDPPPAGTCTSLLLSSWACPRGASARVAIHHSTSATPAESRASLAVRPPLPPPPPPVRRSTSIRSGLLLSCATACCCFASSSPCSWARARPSKLGLAVPQDQVCTLAPMWC